MATESPESVGVQHTKVPLAGSHVVTCLLLSQGRIIAASDSSSIYVYALHDGSLMHELEGHEGGVWVLDVFEDTLVSGSTDRTVRIWDLKDGECIDVFEGHLSTVRCLQISHPESTEQDKSASATRPLIVSGSRDNTLRVWSLPSSEDVEYENAESESVDAKDVDNIQGNPYHKFVLRGHGGAVRALAVHGGVAVSGSYDTDVRVWDIVRGENKWILKGHTKNVYSVAYDPARNHAYSGSLDNDVRVWDLRNGSCVHVLKGHSSLVGHLRLSDKYLVSACAAADLRVWDLNTGDLKHVLAGHTGAITCFQHDDLKVVSGSDGTLKLWDIRDGSLVQNISQGNSGVWQVAFEGEWCVCASNDNSKTFLHIWKFGEADKFFKGLSNEKA